MSNFNLPPGVSVMDEHINPTDPTPDDMQDDDYVISWSHKGYFVNQDINQDFSDFDDAMAAIAEDMNKNQYWPSVWEVNDHGNVTLWAIYTDTLKDGIVEYESVQAWV